MAREDTTSGADASKKKGDQLGSLLKSMGGGDCDRPACDDTKSALSAALQRVGEARAASKSTKQSTNNRACPPTREEIGSSTWSLLHSMAAWYPTSPSTEDKQHMSGFMHALARFYPCTWCAADFQQNIELSPPQTESREDLCLWLCEQHNHVNQKLGKPLFKCTMEKLDERWRESKNPKCNE